ncbi:hypothetical protein PZA11_007470 [Diplocarpon coronariae]
MASHFLTGYEVYDATRINITPGRPSTYFWLQSWLTQLAYGTGAKITTMLGLVILPEELDSGVADSETVANAWDSIVTPAASQAGGSTVRIILAENTGRGIADCMSVG